MRMRKYAIEVLEPIGAPRIGWIQLKDKKLHIVEFEDATKSNNVEAMNDLLKYLREKESRFMFKLYYL